MRDNVFLFAEVPLPPISRANLRMYQLGLALKERGCNAHFIVPSFHPHKRENIKFHGVYVHQYPGFAAFLYSGVRLLIRSLHLIFSICYSVILHKRVGMQVIHGWNPLAGLAAILSGKLIHRPVVVDLTDFYSDIAQTDSPWTSPVFRRIESYIITSATKLIVVSDVMKEFIMHTYGVSADKLYIISDGTDPERFNPRVDGKKIRSVYNLGSSPVLICHGDVKFPDGVDVLLKAFAILNKKRPDVKLIILGGGSKYFDDLKKKFKSLEPSVLFVGWVQHNEVPEYIAAADIGVIPIRSTLNHNCYVSFKLFEYWGVGKPVIASRVDAISNIIKDGTNGILVEPGSVNSLVAGLLFAIDNLDKTKNMGKNGRKLVEEKYNWQYLMEEEAKLYGDLLSRGKN